ncbi:porin family protein [Tenacibaculum amylolyticum]|uniref:porin family protein n=1 Tax=Tenacibaculum amylolyticum TaxID=104269 RepID=UPI0038961642
MKKVLLTVLFAVSLFSVNAQSVKFGVKAGLNFATVNGDDVGTNVDPRTGFHAGGVAELKLTDKFSIQPELLFSQLGSQSEGNKVRLNYLSLPVMAKFYLIEGLSVEAGPQASLLIDDKIELVSGATPNVNWEDFEFGLNIGAGYTFNNGLFLQTRYAFGLTSIQEISDDTRNGSFQVSVGYLF